MRVLLARVTIGALRVVDAGMAERRVGAAKAEPELHLGLQLLAHTAGRLLVAVGAVEVGMAGIGRALGVEAGGLRHRHRGDRRRDNDGAQQIGGALDPDFGRRIGGCLGHVSTTAP
jgi:hypothetical protein